jgi:hypothetical protein
MYVRYLRGLIINLAAKYLRPQWLNVEKSGQESENLTFYVMPQAKSSTYLQLMSDTAKDLRT